MQKRKNQWKQKLRENIHGRYKYYRNKHEITDGELNIKTFYRGKKFYSNVFVKRTRNIKAGQ